MLQDIEKHREIAMEYVKYFESTTLASQTLDAPKGTRLERVEVLCCMLDNMQSRSCSHTLLVQSCAETIANSGALLLCAEAPVVMPKRMCPFWFCCCICCWRWSLHF